MATRPSEPTIEAKSATPGAPPVKRRKPAPESDAAKVLGVKFLTRIDPDEDFSDVDGDPKNQFSLDNEEGDRHYHYASQADVGEYKAGVVPYRVERATKDGVAPLMGADDFKEGEPIVKKGMILVSCDKEKWQKRNRFEYVKTRKTNERMFRTRQSDVDLRRGNDELREEQAEVQREMRS